MLLKRNALRFDSVLSKPYDSTEIKLSTELKASLGLSKIAEQSL
jgi:hypothetical protein